MSILGLFKRKPEPLVLHSELGTFVLEHPQKDRFYEGELSWLGTEVSVDLEAGSGETADAAMGHLRRIMASAADWEERVRAFAAEELSGGGRTIETWEEDGEGGASELTREAFLRRVSIGFIRIHADGELYFYYDMDGMFTDHGLGVYANISGEISSAEICG